VKDRPSGPPTLTSACAAVCAVFAAMIFAATSGGVASAAMVSGVLNEHAGPPAKERQLHFENRLSGDMFLTPTDDTGAFEADLPPGVYDLRSERGLIIKRPIVVDREVVNLGTLRDPPRLDVRRPFQREGIAETVIHPAAPATANVAAGTKSLKDQADVATAAPPPADAPAAPAAAASPAPPK